MRRCLLVRAERLVHRIETGRLSPSLVSPRSGLDRDSTNIREAELETHFSDLRRDLNVYVGVIRIVHSTSDRWSVDGSDISNGGLPRCTLELLLIVHCPRL